MKANRNAIGALLKLARRTSEHLLLNIDSQTSEDRKELIAIMSSAIDGIETTSVDTKTPSQTNVRALRHAPKVFGASVPPSLDGLRQAAFSAFGYVNWAEFYAENNWSRPFLSEFANGEGVGPDGVLTNHEVILGLFLMGPNTYYPPHAHPAEEFYVVLSGDASFQVGTGGQPNRKHQGDVVVHRKNEVHASHADHFLHAVSLIRCNSISASAEIGFQEL
ncbi:dimethylsulfonioproprionate lyase family protein [Ruegeria arenilitoris]|uniref:dimethylsulfonioproprionate lyase family protein n=1 Tax=Ruegeria arenilitoris TaxID=1173585 RepID=UPI00147A6DDE|nr:dimethylsulfonioproprionate lyase family protein [Ruegeria arenilitoris]